MIITEYIPVGKFELFDTLLKTYNGRYRSNPYTVGYKTYVHYYIDEQSYIEMYRLLNLEIIEKPYKKSFVKKVLNNMKYFYKKWFR